MCVVRRERVGASNSGGATRWQSKRRSHTLRCGGTCGPVRKIQRLANSVTVRRSSAQNRGKYPSRARAKVVRKSSTCKTRAPNTFARRLRRPIVRKLTVLRAPHFRPLLLLLLRLLEFGATRSAERVGFRRFGSALAAELGIAYNSSNVITIRSFASTQILCSVWASRTCSARQVLRCSLTS